MSLEKRSRKYSKKVHRAKSAAKRTGKADKARKTKRRLDLLESLSSDDPNYETAKRSYLEAWSDSHRLVA